MVGDIFSFVDHSIACLSVMSIFTRLNGALPLTEISQ